MLPAKWRADLAAVMLEAEIRLGVSCSSAGEFRMAAGRRKDWGNIGGLGVFVLEKEKLKLSMSGKYYISLLFCPSLFQIAVILFLMGVQQGKACKIHNIPWYRSDHLKKLSAWAPG